VEVDAYARGRYPLHGSHRVKPVIVLANDLRIEPRLMAASSARMLRALWKTLLRPVDPLPHYGLDSLLLLVVPVPPLAGLAPKLSLLELFAEASLRPVLVITGFLVEECPEIVVDVYARKVH
jgi:hypothetical protein